MNVELLEKVKAHIMEEPKRLRMSNWAADVTSDKFYHDKPPCGTVGCIAGWTVMLATGKSPKLLRDFRIGEKAVELLDIKDEQATGLFHAENWPREFYVPYRETFLRTQTDEILKERAKVTCDRIDYFIATGM